MVTTNSQEQVRVDAPKGKNSRNVKYPSKRNPNKPKITKEERNAKYTQIARNRRDKKFEQERSSDLTCFRCRQRGHMAARCPSNNNNSQPSHSKNNVVQDNNGGRICYKCGSMDHGLSNCPKLPFSVRNQGKSNGRINYNELDLPFASCFVCHQKGHLASQCDQNQKGIYINGGCCRLCQSNQHRATECPTLIDDKEKNKNDENEGLQEDFNVEELLEQQTQVDRKQHVGKTVDADVEKKKKPTKKRAVKF